MVKLTLIYVFMALGIGIWAITDHRPPNSDETNNGRKGTDLMMVREELALTKQKLEEVKKELRMVQLQMETMKECLTIVVSCCLGIALISTVWFFFQGERNGMMREFKSTNAEVEFKVVKLEIEKSMRVLWEKIKSAFEPEKGEEQNFASKFNSGQLQILSANCWGTANCWDSANCHADLSIVDSLMVVERHGNTKAFCYASVRAVSMLPRSCQGIFYFEVTIIKRRIWGVPILLGLAPRSLKMKANTNFDDFAGCYFYDSFGGFFGHHVEGCKYYYDGDGNVMPFVDGNPDPAFGSGEVIGCSVNLATRQIIYTKNGKRLDTSNLFVSKSADLFPFVALRSIGDKVEANFGHRNFVYDLSNEPIMRGTGV